MARATLAGVQAHLGAQQLVELMVNVVSYKMVSRFLEAMDLHGDDQC